MSAPETEPPTSWRRMFGVVVMVTLILTALLTAFALPQINLGPREVPIAVAGPAPAAQQLTAQLEKAGAEAFEITRVASADQARELILDHEVYGAIVVGDPKPSVMIANAASPAVARVLSGVADQMERSPDQIRVEDVRPLPEDDPTGAGLAAGALPLVLGGWIASVVMLLTLNSTSRRVVGAFLFSVVGGLTLGAMLRYAFGSVDGNYLLISGVLALSIAATTWMILGLRSAFGNAGLGIGAVMLIILGNPLSGLSSAPEMLPSGWSDLGQSLPPGAGGTLLRSASYFEGKGAGDAVWVLVGWLAGGMVLFLIAEVRSRRGSRKTASKGSPEPAVSADSAAAADSAGSAGPAGGPAGVGKQFADDDRTTPSASTGTAN